MIKDTTNPKKYLRDHIFITIGHPLSKDWISFEGIEGVRTLSFQDRGLARILTQVPSFPWNRPLAPSVSDVRRRSPELVLEFPENYRGYHMFNYEGHTIWLLVGIKSRWKNYYHYLRSFKSL